MELKINSTTVQQGIIRMLREAIMVGHFKPGERLVETSLCERLGVSRPSLREALRVLAAEQLVVITPNRGPSVALIEWEEAQQIYHTRALLEGETAVLAARNAGQAEIEGMRSALQRFEKAVKTSNAAQRVATTTEFYDSLIAASGNHVIGGLIRGLMARINFLRFRTMARPGRARHSLREMKLILEAVEAGDARSARAAAVAHVRAAELEAQDVYHDSNEQSA